MTQIGESLTVVGLPWFVLQSAGDILAMGAVATAAAAATAVFGVLSGPFVDRLGFVRTSVVAYAVGGTAVGAIPLLHATGQLPFGLLIALAMAATALDGPGRTALSGLIGVLARAARMPLESANSLFQGTGQLIFLITPAIGGVVATTAGAHWLLAIDSIACLLAAALVGLLVRVRYGTGLPAESDDRVPDSPALGLAAGYRVGVAIAKADPVVRFLLVSPALLGALDLAVLSIGLVAYSHLHLGGAAGFGLLITAYGLGAVAGATAFGLAGTRVPRRTVLLAGYLARLALIPVLLTGPALPVLMVAVGVAGLSGPPLETVSTTVLQERVPTRAYGRVVGLRFTVSAAAGPLAVGGLAIAVSGIGLAGGLGVLAVGYVSIVVFAMRHPATKQLSHRRGSESHVS